jgi:dihydrofolate synthase/folylpolyglutamate synthase
MITSVDEGFAYLESFVNTERGSYKPRSWRISRMRDLLADFENPQLSYRTVHVAGSKGKGSTACYVANICHAAGVRAGLYSSPHLLSYRERIRVLDGTLSDELLTQSFEEIRRYVEKKSESVPAAELPTTFELMTLLAFLAFKAAGCSVAVIEVGLGGRLDATSLVQAECCLITPIEYEHTEYLGNTLRSIAAEKGAILRKGVTAFSASQEPEAAETLARIAFLRQVPLAFLKEGVHGITSELRTDGTRCEFALADGPEIAVTLRMIGTVQAQNAALATLAARSLFPELDSRTIERGLESAVLPGRSEIIPGKPATFLDGAHTPRSIALLCETVREICPNRNARALIFGSVAGKRHREMLELLAKEFDRIIVCRPGTFKESHPELLTEICRELGGSCEREDDAAKAIAKAGSNPDTSLLVVTGSFYLAGKIRAAQLDEPGAKLERQ